MSTGLLFLIRDERFVEFIRDVRGCETEVRRNSIFQSAINRRGSNIIWWNSAVPCCRLLLLFTNIQITWNCDVLCNFGHCGIVVTRHANKMRLCLDERIARKSNVTNNKL